MLAILNANPWLLVLAVFLARVLDVSLGTVRTIAVVRGYASLSAVIGFIETLIWLAAAGQVLKDLDRWYLAVAYAGGFAAGNMVGIWLESRLALGHVVVQAVSENPDVSVASQLREQGYAITELRGTGDDRRPVEISLTVESRRELPELLATVSAVDPAAFCSVTDLRTMRQARLRASPLVGGWRARLKRR